MIEFKLNKYISVKSEWPDNIDYSKYNSTQDEYNEIVESWFDHEVGIHPHQKYDNWNSGSNWNIPDIYYKLN